MKELSKQKCVPCTRDATPLKGEALRAFQNGLGNGWKIIEEHHLEKEFTLKDFKSALDLTNDIGEVAEEEGHHPDIFLSWGKVKVKIWTHKIQGLSESDFILAAKCDVCYLSRFGK